MKTTHTCHIPGNNPGDCKSCKPATAVKAPTYRIVRTFESKPASRKGLPSGLTLEQAQEHCRDLNTSSSTAWKTSAVERTKRYGRWFDGYEQEAQ